jgi:hypothetical protein
VSLSWAEGHQVPQLQPWTVLGFLHTRNLLFLHWKVRRGIHLIL